MRSPRDLTDSDNVIPRNLTPEVLQALRAVRFIAQHIKDADKDNEVGTPQLPCPLLLRTVRAKGGRGSRLWLLWCVSYAHFLSLLLFILAIRLPLIIVYCSQLDGNRGEEEKSRGSAGRESPKCATLNCKILNHNFIFYYASSLLKADDDHDEANEILWLAIASNLFGHRTKAEADTECEVTKTFSVCSSMFYDYCEMIFEFELYRLYPFFFLFCSAICQMIFLSPAQIVEDWKFVSMVLDRFFLWLFTLSCVFGTCAIICQSPSLYDTRAPIDRQLSEIPLRKNNFMLPPDIVRQVVN